MGFKNQFPGNHSAGERIETGKRLLQCMSRWSNVDIIAVTMLIDDYNAFLVIEEDTGLLMVQLDCQVQLHSLNNYLIKLGGGDYSRGVELGMPKTIWPDYKEPKKA